MRASRIHVFLNALVLLLIASVTGPAALAQDTPNRSITQIAGDLYRFQNNSHFSVFYVTEEGIIVTDPINADAAEWLKEELANRFPGTPIRYLIYSHDHADHISGGEVFDDDTTMVVAHANAVTHIVGESRPTAVPEITFTDRMTIQLGGKEVELIHLGRNHSDNSIVMRFPAERAVFAVDANAYFSRPAPRVADGVAQLAFLLHPEAVPDPGLSWIELVPATH